MTEDYIKNLDTLSDKELIPFNKAWNKIGTELLHKKRSSSALLAELGYDAIRVERRSDDMPHTVILNRSKVILFEGEL